MSGNPLDTAIDVARTLFGAGAAVAPLLPPGVRDVVRLVSLGLDLADTIRGKGMEPVSTIAEMIRTVDRFDADTRREESALDQLLARVAATLPNAAAIGAPPAAAPAVAAEGPAPVAPEPQTADAPMPPSGGPVQPLRTSTAPFGHPAPADAPEGPAEAPEGGA